MNLKKMNRGLDFLREKYGAAKGTITMKGGHCFVGKTPLIPGRMERKIVELKKFTENGTLEGVSTLRFASFGPNVYHNGAPNDRYTVQYTYFDEWIGLIDEFVSCIREHKTPLINLKWHRQTIQSMLGCYESISTGRIARIRG